MAITYIASTGRPGDNSTQGGNVTSPLLIATAGAQTGDLVTVCAQYKGTNSLILGAESGGMSWNSLAQFNDTANLSAVCWFWCRWDSALYNGNNPNFDCSGGSSTVAYATVAHIFRPTATNYLWAIDVGQISASYAAPAGAVTISGITTIKPSTVSIAGWFSEDDNSWGTLTGTGWNVAGDPQYRNTTGSDISSSYAYKIQSTAGATGNVSKTQTANGPDPGATSIFSFYEYAVVSNNVILNQTVKRASTY